jgi:hypothetical protein
MPACGEVHKTMQEITSISNSYSQRKYTRTEQNQELQSVLDYFTERQPFGTDYIELHSLSSGVVAVNVDSAEAVGNTILSSMDGMSVSQFKFTKNEQVTTLASSVYVSCDGKKIETDTQQLYQRLLVAGIGTIDVSTLFQYELCSYRTSVFDQKLMRQADKADFQNGLIKSPCLCY